MTRIILIGYMGAGKTTIGKALSKELGIIFYDLDWYIESRMRKTVSEIFAERGEEGFRQIEYNMLHEVAEFENVIISCGGGTPCFFDNMDYMNGQGETVYLKASPEVLYGHLKKFDEDPKLEVINGRYGPYLVYDGKNYRLPKSMHEKAAELTYEECMKVIKAVPANRKS